MSLTTNLYVGDCRDVLTGFEPNSIDAVVTDPPYELGFMGKKWDSTGVAFDVETWARVLNVMKPGAWLLAFGGTRTFHRMVAAIEDAGFEIRDCLTWNYMNGFPKSKSCLKPSFEPITLARKPVEGTTFHNVAKWGTGLLNIDESRIGTNGGHRLAPDKDGFNAGIVNAFGGHLNSVSSSPVEGLGRWPANTLLDSEVADLIDETYGTTKSSQRTGKRSGKDTGILGEFTGQEDVVMGHNDEGGYSRMFYRAPSERGTRPGGFGNVGADSGSNVPNGPTYTDEGGYSRFFFIPKVSKKERAAGLDKPTTHPTMKPVELLGYLVNLITPAGGTVLDPFSGVSSTGVAAIQQARNYVGIEKEEEYIPIAQKRIDSALKEHWQK